MVISYIKMLYVTSSKKILPWIILALGLVGTICAFYFFIHGESKLGPVVNSLPNSLYAAPFFGLSFYATVIAIHLFKDHEKDGTELLVISKPLSRRNILLAKFFVLFTLLLAIHLLYFFGLLIATSADKHASMHDKVMPAVSVLIGGFIISTLIASVAIFFSCFVGALGTLFVTASLVAVFPIMGIILQETSNAQLNKEIIGAKTFKGLKADGTVMEDSNSIYQFPQEPGFNGASQTQEESFARYKRGTKYSTTAYFDVWYQWSQFYSVFNASSNNSMGVAKISKRESTVPKTEYSIEDKNHVWHTFFPGESVISSFAEVDSMVRETKHVDINAINAKATEFYSWLNRADSSATDPAVATAVGRVNYFNNLSLRRRLLVINNFLFSNPAADLADRNYNILTDDVNSNHTNLYAIYVYNKIKADHNNITLPDFETTVNAEIADTNHFNKSFKLVGQKVESFVVEDYISKGVVVAIWLPIALLLVALASWRYIKKDFK